MNEQEIREATFGAGCFWCVEAIFEGLNGVLSVESGYSGGAMANPSYKEICTGKTGHAEVIRIRFDSSVISFETLLDVFFHTHDPTTLNRQGADVGTQYRSVVFYHDENQKQLAEQIKERVNRSGVYDRPLVTEISPLKNYYPAENYHQDYFQNNPGQPYCKMVIEPKFKKFQERYRLLLKE